MIAENKRAFLPANRRQCGTERIPIRPASTVIMLRGRGNEPKILLGRRNHQAAFMPGKFVFPGGTVDPGDRNVRLAGMPKRSCLRRLDRQSESKLARLLLLAAIREVWEETGLRFASHVTPFHPQNPPSGWQGFAKFGKAPSATGFQFVFRAITPPGTPRRFDARFFLADLRQASLLNDADDFNPVSDELTDIHWVTFAQAASLDLPLITRLALKEVREIIRHPDKARCVPFHHSQNGQWRVELIP